jgi:hypothetical protein
MKKVLLIGDSIRQSYQPHVAELLKDEAVVVGPEDNCKFAKYTTWYIKAWVDELGHPDVIHWNNGIWDAYRQNDDIGVFTSIEDYVRDLSRTLVEMRKYAPTIVWATTTPVDDRFEFLDNATVDRYNAAALQLMARNGIPVDDLNAVLRDRIATSFSEDRLHLNEAGQKACAEAVAAAVRKYL